MLYRFSSILLFFLFFSFSLSHSCTIFSNLIRKIVCKKSVCIAKRVDCNNAYTYTMRSWDVIFFINSWRKKITTILHRAHICEASPQPCGCLKNIMSFIFILRAWLAKSEKDLVSFSMCARKRALRLQKNKFSQLIYIISRHVLSLSLTHHSILVLLFWCLKTKKSRDENNNTN